MSFPQCRVNGGLGSGLLLKDLGEGGRSFKTDWMTDGVMTIGTCLSLRFLKPASMVVRMGRLVFAGERGLTDGDGSK